MEDIALLLLICFISTGFGCEDTPALYNLKYRARNIAFQYTIDDFNLNDGWYSATSRNISYVMVTNATLPPYGGCGALYGIYMIGEHPNATTLPDGTEIDVEACLRSYFGDCDINYNIKIRNCGGELQYYLRITERNAGYCFDPPEFASVEGLSEAPNATLGNIAVTPRLVYKLVIVQTGKVENYFPSTVFECEFTQQIGFFYLVEWYYNNILLVTLGQTTNVTELLLTDDMITEKNVTLGVNFKCGVSVSVDYFGIRTTVNFSDNFFAGIVFNNLTMYVPKTESGTITFKTTLPIGCEYNRIKPDLSDCFIDLHMLPRNYTCESETQTLYSLTGSLQRRCGVRLKTLKKDEQWDPEQVYNITIATKDENYADQNTFIQDFNIQYKVRYELWSNYRPKSITVIITDIAVNRNKYCYSHVDPHLKTPDNVLYDQHEVGYFLLYNHTQYNIQVQERTESCNYNLAKCTCAVLVKAGADIVMFQTCSDRVPFIGYTACGDNGILQTIRVSDNKYQVYTPIGTYIEVYLYTYGLYEGMMNVYIHMSPKDFNHTEGLCGSYDDDPSNDFTTRQGQILNNNANYGFSKTWKLQDNETYFTPNSLELTVWSDVNPLYCYCEDDDDPLTGNIVKTTCSAKPTENCTVTTPNDVTKQYCAIVSNKNKRSVSNHLEERKRRFNLVPIKQPSQRWKRSTAVNITEVEANTTCEDIIGSSLVATNFTDFISLGEIDEKIKQCIYDVLDSNDLAAANRQFDTLNSMVNFEINQNPDYIANNTEQVHAFKQQSCPNNCSAQGTCVDGSCQCDRYFHGTECAIDERDQLKIIDITGDGVCDLLTSECTCYSVLTRRLIQEFTFKYSLSHLTIDGNYNLTNTLTSSGEYLSIFEGIVCITSPSSTENFVSHYNISISNDGITFSQPAEMHIYDSTCQQYILDGFGTYTFFLKAGYCNINGKCYAEDDIDTDNSCNVCQTSSANRNWTSVCRDPDDGEAKSDVIVIVVGSMGGIIVIVVICFIAFKVKSTTSSVQSTYANSNDNTTHESLNRRQTDFPNSIYQSRDDMNDFDHVYTSHVDINRSDHTGSCPAFDTGYFNVDNPNHTDSNDQSSDENNHHGNVNTGLYRNQREVICSLPARETACHNHPIHMNRNMDVRDENNQESQVHTQSDRGHDDVTGFVSDSDTDNNNRDVTLNTETYYQLRNRLARDDHAYDKLHSAISGKTNNDDDIVFPKSEAGCNNFRTINAQPHVETNPDNLEYDREDPEESEGSDISVMRLASKEESKISRTLINVQLTDVNNIDTSPYDSLNRSKMDITNSNDQPRDEINDAGHVYTKLNLDQRDFTGSFPARDTTYYNVNKPIHTDSNAQPHVETNPDNLEYDSQDSEESEGSDISVMQLASNKESKNSRTLIVVQPRDECSLDSNVYDRVESAWPERSQSDIALQLPAGEDQCNNVDI